ncbi:hypothetical protein K402DRAFT_317385, partial [Aulographum hederae CBS 113979]
KHPYHPLSWLHKATHNLHQGFPELAAGDAYKALILADSILRVSVRRGNAALGFKMGFCMLEKDLSDSVQYYLSLLKKKAYHLLRESLIKLNLFSEAIFFNQMEQRDYIQTAEGENTGKSAETAARPYPWMESRHLTRPSWVIEQIQKDFDENVACQKQGTQFCKTTPVQQPDHVLGVFAKRDIPQGALIVMDNLSIELPLSCLTYLDVDIFAEDRFDIWVLRTMQARIKNNRWGKWATRSAGEQAGISPLFTLFNHSCEPNVKWTDNDSAVLLLTTARDVKEGEELFISYDGNKGTLEERNEHLQHWLPGPCRCTKCERQ